MLLRITFYIRFIKNQNHDQCLTKLIIANQKWGAKTACSCRALSVSIKHFRRSLTSSMRHNHTSNQLKSANQRLELPSIPVPDVKD